MVMLWISHFFIFKLYLFFYANKTFTIYIYRPPQRFWRKISHSPPLMDPNVDAFLKASNTTEGRFDDEHEAKIQPQSQLHQNIYPFINTCFSLFLKMHIIAFPKWLNISKKYYTFLILFVINKVPLQIGNRQKGNWCLFVSCLCSFFVTKRQPSKNKILKHLNIFLLKDLLP